MDFELAEDQRLIQESTRRMVADFINPILKSKDRRVSLPKNEMLKILQRFAEEGLTTPRLPVDVGGSNMRMLDYGLVIEQLPSMIGHALMAQEVTITRLRAGGNEDQWREMVPDLIAGKRICCTASSEPGTGSNPRQIITRMRVDGDHVVVNGRKMWITNGTISDVVLVTCTTGGSEKAEGLLQRVAIDRAIANYETTKIDCIGLWQGHIAEILFDDCRVPKSGAMSDDSDLARLLQSTWNANRALLGLMAVNMAQRAFDAAVKYAGMRTQFGRLIGGTQLVQEHLVNIYTAIETSRLICYKALSQVDNGQRVNASSAAAKRYATTACLDAISAAIAVHGAIGLTVELELEELLRDARMLLVPDGTNEILTLIIGRELTGQSALRA